MEAPGSFRPHEVLRAHLDGLLREWEGADAVHKRYRQAAETLERHEQFADAVLAYCRGEDWASVGRLLGDRGAEVAARPGSWLLSLPSSLVQTDPWLLLAVARQQRADGRVADAIATFHAVERNALTSQPVLDGATRAAAAGVARRPLQPAVARLGRRAPRRSRGRPGRGSRLDRESLTPRPVGAGRGATDRRRRRRCERGAAPGA